MKDFLKYTFATITGVILSSIVLSLVAVLVVAGMISGSDSETSVSKNSVMMLELNGTLAERSRENPLKQLFADDVNAYGLDDILASIKKAKEHNDIKGIYIQANYLATSFASLQEIRNALADFKESGKFLIVYGDYYTQGLYYLSSVADKVMMNPKGRLEWKGLASTPMFYKEMLEKIGVEMQIFKVGTYKSAVEPFTNTKMSDANREQVAEYANSIWGEMTKAVSDSRNIPVDSLNRLADRTLLFAPAEEVVGCGMIDTLVYKNDIRDYLKKMTGTGKDDKLPLLTLNQMINVKKNVPKDKSGNIVAVYYAYGAIDSGSSSEEGIDSKKVIKDLRRLKEDENVKAVVLRVNSPGGSAFGSEQIWHAVGELKKEKPVVVSMGDYAASGGYYIACVADYIVADPTTLTGSIGIFGMLPNVEKLTKKVGLGFDVVKTNTYADFGAMGRALNEGEKAQMQLMINEGYDLFVTRCAEGRGMTKEQINKIAEGRVWTGSKAKELGLVDELGDLSRALEIAVERAEVSGYTVISYPAKESVLASLLKNNPTKYIENRILKSKLGDYYNHFNLLNEAENMDVIQARMPFDLIIK